MYVTENIMLSDNISGEWRAYVEESHPLINDWMIFGTITKIDELNCNYQFVMTSGISGGEDDEIV